MADREALPATGPADVNVLLAETPGRRTQTILLPLLAVLTALALGALVIVFTNRDALFAWARFFRHPIPALSASWTAVREAYYALFTGALGSPSQLVHAFASGQLDQ